MITIKSILERLVKSKAKNTILYDLNSLAYDAENILNSYDKTKIKEEEKIIDKFKEIWVREQGDLISQHLLSGFYVVGLLLEVFEEINKEKK